MSSLAKRYNISDVALGKVCRKLLVPVPPRGYWARVEHGYKGHGQTSPRCLKGRRKRREKPRFCFDLANCRMKCSETLSLIRRTTSLSIVRDLFTVSLLQRKSSCHGSQTGLGLRYRWTCESARNPKIEPSPSTLVYALEERGFSVERTSRERECSVIVVKGECLTFGLVERTARVAVPPGRSRRCRTKFRLTPDPSTAFHIQT
jgi:hypothetical protein